MISGQPLRDDWPLTVGWVVAAHSPAVPHPILLVRGKQGTAKSNLIRSPLALIGLQPTADP